MESAIMLHEGLLPGHLSEAVEIYDTAFAEKLSVAIPDPGARRQLFLESFSPDACISAACQGELVGVVGYHVHDKAFSGGVTGGGMGWRTLRKHLGFVKAWRAWFVFALFGRKADSSTLLLDGIAVKETFRGRGAGQLLLHGVIAFARRQSFQSIRLDVIATNPRARALYEKIGFTVHAVHDFPYLKGVLGFGRSYTMMLKL